MAFQSHFYDSFKTQLMEVVTMFRDFMIEKKFKFQQEAYARKPFSYIFKRKEPNEFLGSSTLVNSDNPKIQSTAGVLIKDDKFDTIISMSNYVIKKIKYSEDVGDLPWEDRTADQILNREYGMCSDTSILLTALLRSANIPARMKSGKIKGEFAFHGWVEVYYDGRWLDIDPTLWGGIDDEWAEESVQHMFDDYLEVETADEDSGDYFGITLWDFISW